VKCVISEHAALVSRVIAIASGTFIAIAFGVVIHIVLVVVTPDLIVSIATPDLVITEASIQFVIAETLAIDFVITKATLDGTTIVCLCCFSCVDDVVSAFEITVFKLTIIVAGLPITIYEISTLRAIDDVVAIVAVKIVIAIFFELSGIMGPQLVVAVSTIE